MWVAIGTRLWGETTESVHIKYIEEKGDGSARKRRRLYVYT
jgi:hypothetical protein